MTYTSRHPARILHHPGSIRRGMNIAITGLQELTAYLQAKPTIQAKPAKENLVRMINQMIPAALETQDLKFQERYLSVTERPHYTELYECVGKKQPVSLQPECRSGCGSIKDVAAATEMTWVSIHVVVGADRRTDFNQPGAGTGITPSEVLPTNTHETPGAIDIELV